jgi:hypothetical protein
VGVGFIKTCRSSALGWDMLALKYLSRFLLGGLAHETSFLASSSLANS